MNEAPLDAIYRYLALVHPGQAGWNSVAARAAFQRAKPVYSTCHNGPPKVRLRAYPAFEEIDQAPATQSYSFLTFDIDASGQPENVRIVGSGGNADLDRRSEEAIRQSRFAPASKKGCTYFYWRNQTDPLVAPEPPPASAYRPEDSSCPEEGKPGWETLPRLVFPEEFRRRNIEGWAIILFDVAPWGDVGNVRVAAAEPAALFGERATAIVGGAKRPASSSGYRGCTIRVVFKLPPDEPSEEPNR